jgi:hypothetical protein
MLGKLPVGRCRKKGLPVQNKNLDTEASSVLIAYSTQLSEIPTKYFFKHLVKMLRD